MTIQERKDIIYHNYGADVDNLDSNQLRAFAEELDFLANDLEDQEALANTMKHEMIRAINDVALKYKDKFDTIYLYGNDVASIEFDDVDFEE